MEDEVFQVGIATYLGQPCPLMAPVVGCYFGKHGKQLDWCGANLAAASLPGHGHCSQHNKLQPITQAMVKLGGIHSSAEAGNFLVDKIGHPLITFYVNHVSSHPIAQKAPYAIVPDIHAFNFQQEGSKLMTVGPCLLLTRSLKSKHSQHTKADMTAATPILGQWINMRTKSSYLVIKNSRSLDCLFAADVVGDGTSEVVGPFEAAKKRFFRGNGNTNLRRLVRQSKQGL
jgi:hypothetical protein